MARWRLATVASRLNAMATSHDPGFITHAELDALLSERTRQRWQERGLLPHPLWVRADRTRVALLPNAILLTLISDPLPAWQVEHLVNFTQQIEQTGEFQGIAELVRNALQTAGGSWTLARIIAALPPSARAELQTLSERLTPTLQVLADAGAAVNVVESTVVSVDAGSVAVEMDGHTRRFPALHVLQLHVGDLVMIWHVQIEDRSREYLLPSLEIRPDLHAHVGSITAPVPVELLDTTPHPSALFHDTAEPRRLSLPPPTRTVPSREEMDARLGDRHIDLEAVIYGR